MSTMPEITGLFTREALLAHLKEMPVLKTTVMDAIFPEAAQQQVPLPIVGVDEISTVLTALPVVRRGAASVATQGETIGGVFYEPLPISANRKITGTALNNLKMVDRGGMDVWARGQVDILRKRVRATKEAMCANVLSGTLTWPVKQEGGGWETWTVAFGDIKTVTVAMKWDAASAKMANVRATLDAMHTQLQSSGYGGTVKIWAGKTAWAALSALVEALTSTAKQNVRHGQATIEIDGWVIEKMTETYVNPQTGAVVPKVADKDVVMVATDAGHKLFHCALDDLDANLQPLPFFINPIRMKDPSGWKLVAQSKPFPVINPKGVCKATVIS